MGAVDPRASNGQPTTVVAEPHRCWSDMGAVGHHTTDSRHNAIVVFTNATDHSTDDQYTIVAEPHRIRADL